MQGERRLLQARLVRVLASLPHRQQRLLVLHDMFGIGCDELALTEGATASALRKATSRARRALRDDAYVARLGMLAPVAACMRAQRRAQARMYGWWLRHVGQRRGGMSLTGGEALAPMAMMVCALVPSMMLLPVHPDAVAPHRADGGGVQVGSAVSLALPILPISSTKDADPLTLARPAPALASEGVLVVNNDDNRGAVVGPAEIGAEAPIAAELESRANRARRRALGGRVGWPS